MKYMKWCKSNVYLIEYVLRNDSLFVNYELHFDPLGTTGPCSSTNDLVCIPWTLYFTFLCSYLDRRSGANVQVLTDDGKSTST